MRIVCLTAMRNEGPYLLEWLAWQRLIGVTDFLVYSNDCEDGTDAMLDALAREDVLRHAPNPAVEGKSLQWSALKAGWDHPLRKSADWMMIADVDEFPVIHRGDRRLADLFAAVPANTDAVALPWRLFGASGLDSLADAPVTAQLTRSAPPDLLHPIAGTFFKSLFRPAAFSGAGVHRPKHKKDSRPVWVGGNGVALPDVYAANDKRLSLLGVHAARTLVEMHHYSLRSARAFVVKSERGLPNRTGKNIDLTYWVERNYNSIDNRAALPMQDRLTDEIARLKSLPGIAALHERAVQWHDNRFAELVRQREPYSLYCQVLHSPDSAVLSQEASIRLLKMFGQLDGR